jgi:hypothetical protein
MERFAYGQGRELHQLDSQSLVQELTRFRSWQSNKTSAIGMKKPDLLRRVTAVDRPPIRRSLSNDRNFAGEVLNPPLQPLGVEFYSLFSFVIHWHSIFLRSPGLTDVKALVKETTMMT